MTLASKVVTQLKGSGTILEVHGIPGVQEDNDAFAGFKSVLAQCPDITIAGQVTGDYNPAATQQAVLQFLSSHPGKVDGVFEAGTMTAGIIQAFKQRDGQCRSSPTSAALKAASPTPARTRAPTRSTALNPGQRDRADVRQGGARHARRSRARDRPARHHHQHHRQRQPQFCLPQQLGRCPTPNDAALPNDTFFTSRSRRLPGRPGVTVQSPATSGGAQAGLPPLVAATAVAKSPVPPAPSLRGPGPASRRSPHRHRGERQREEHPGEDPRWVHAPTPDCSRSTASRRMTPVTRRCPRPGIATVFQEVLSVPGSSVTENVWLGAKRSGTTAGERRRRAGGAA